VCHAFQLTPNFITLLDRAEDSVAAILPAGHCHCGNCSDTAIHGLDHRRGAFRVARDDSQNVCSNGEVAFALLGYQMKVIKTN
jgi:hypothetical protein